MCSNERSMYEAELSNASFWLRPRGRTTRCDDLYSIQSRSLPLTLMYAIQLDADSLRRHWGLEDDRRAYA